MTFHVTKIQKLSSDMLSYDNGKKWLLSNACMSSIFYLLVNPDIIKKKEGWGFFLDKPNNLRLAKKKTNHLGVLARKPCMCFFSQEKFIRHSIGFGGISLF